jgi:hypothetical protein
MKTEWWKSKTKVGSLLLGGGMIMSAGGSYILGNTDAAALIKGITAGIGVILVGFGIRNALD